MNKVMKKITMMGWLALVAACSAGERQTYAHITQRRAVDAGKVMITYRFEAGGAWILDSMEVGRAAVVPHDSVKVVYPAENPSKSRLVLP